VYGYQNKQDNVSFLLGTQADILTTADFDSFSGSEYGHVAWNGYGYNSQAATPGDVNTSGNTKLCLRTYTYDYGDTAPGAGASYYIGVHYAEYADVTYDPYIEITEGGGATYTPRVYMFF